MRSKDKVQAAIMDRIQTKTGLDLKGLDVTTTSVAFEKNMAYATVAFHPKGDASVSHGMEMKYTLEQRDGQWQVVNVSDPHGNSAKSPSGMGGQLPPGHPSVEGVPPAIRARFRPPGKADRQGNENRSRARRWPRRRFRGRKFSSRRSSNHHSG